MGLEERWGPPWEEAARKPLRLGGKTLRAESVGWGGRWVRAPLLRGIGGTGDGLFAADGGAPMGAGRHLRGPVLFQKAEQQLLGLNFLLTQFLGTGLLGVHAVLSSTPKFSLGLECCFPFLPAGAGPWSCGIPGLRFRRRQN